MQATPRVLASSDYSAFPYVEMRYIRHPHSPLLAAVIFRVFEECRSPYSHCRRKLKQIDREVEDYVYRAVQLVLKRSVPLEHILTLWNYNNFLLDCLKTALEVAVKKSADGAEEFIAALQSHFGFRMFDIAIGGEGSTNTTFYYYRKEDSIVLLYTEYEMGSFLVIPACSHVHLKYQLFAKARYYMGNRPMDRANFAGIQMVCGCMDCPVPISEFVFDQAKKATEVNSRALGTELYPSLVSGGNNALRGPKNTGVCNVCGVRPEGSICGKGKCKICKECMIISFYATRTLQCPKCRKAESGEVMHNAVVGNGAIEGVIGFDLSALRWESEKTNCHSDSTHREPTLPPKILSRYAVNYRQCESCQNQKEIGEYSLYLLSAHSCFHCNTCTKKTALLRSPLCPTCSKQLPLEDIDRCGVMVTKGVNAVRCSECALQQPRFKFKYSEKTSHWWKCKRCDDCIEKGKKRQLCYCRKPYTSEDMKALKVLWEDGSSSEEEKKEETKGKPRKRQKVATEIQKKCPMCNELKPENQFSSIKIRDYFACLACSAQIPPSTAARRDSLGAGAPTNVCRKCSTAKEFSQFSTFHMLDHGCKVCNQCLQGSSLLQCEICQHVYNSQDGQELQKLGISAPPRPQVHRCNCNRVQNKNSIICPNGCRCSDCLFEHILVRDFRECPVCHNALIGDIPKTVNCSNCGRTLTAATSQLAKRAIAVCGTNHHVLCVYCVYFYGEQYCCKVCYNPVTARDSENILQEQTQFTLGCYCGDRGVRTVKLDCQHEIHVQCKSTLFACRLCWGVPGQNRETIVIDS